MHQPSYIATGERINGRSIAIIESAPLNQLITMLDKINAPRIVFKYGIRMLDTRQHIAYIIQNRFGYTVCTEVGNDNVMRPLSNLPVADITSLIQRLRVDYKELLKGE